MENNVKNKAISGMIWKFLERFLAQGISLIVSIIIARILTPSEYGVVSLVTIFFTFANVLISGGLNTALIQKKDADKTDYSSVFWVSLGISLILYAIMYLLAPVISNVYGLDILRPIIRVMGLSLPIYALKSIICAYISATLQFRRFFFSTIGGSVLSAIVGVFMAISGFGAWSLVAQQMLNVIVGTAILYATTKAPIGFIVSINRLKNLLKYGWKILLSSLINTTYNEVTPLFIGVKFSSADLSFYSKGRLFPNTLSSTITNTFSSVLFPIMAKYQDDKEKILHYTRLYMRLASFCVFPAMLGIFAVSDNFIRVILTEKWIDASYYLRIFCVSLMFDVISVGNCETIKAIGRSDVFLRIEIIKKACYFGTLVLFLLLAKTPELLAVSSLIAMLIQIIVNSVPNKKLIGYTVRQQVLDLLPNLICSVFMCVIVLMVGRISLSPVLGLVAQIASGIAVYTLTTIISKNDSMRFILRHIKNRLRDRN